MPRTSPRFTLIDDGEAVQAAGSRLTNRAQVLVLVAGEWYPGELQLGRRPACVWVDELGTVLLEDDRDLPCQVQGLLPGRKASGRPAA